jgi:hypothetical protein
MATSPSRRPRFVMPAGGIGPINALALASLVALVLGLLLPVLFDAELALLFAIYIAAAAVSLLCVRLLVPSRYEIYDDRLRLTFLFGNWDIGFETVASVEPARAWQSYALWGLRFATAPRQSIHIARVRARLFGRPNLVISPASRDRFLPELQAALAEYSAAGR